jgi:trehalose/maltose transport system substrate-binding protein
MSRRGILGLAGLLFLAAAARAEELSIVTAASGVDLEILRQQLDQFERYSGNRVRIVPRSPSPVDQFADYRKSLNDPASTIDVYGMDAIWAPQLAAGLADLTGSTSDVVAAHFPVTAKAQTVDGRLMALPVSAEAPVLYYRKDLLDRYGFKPPATWAELAATARAVMEKERAAGNAAMWGYVFQGAPYEGLTGNALEWIAANGGGAIVDPDGTVTIDNPKAAAALDRARSWIGTIAPPDVLNFTEEESRAIWQAGNAVFMRNWPYAYALSNAMDSPLRGRFDIAPLPAGEGGNSTATLGGWALALSKNSQHREAGTALIRYLAASEAQTYRALRAADLPTLPLLYDDRNILEEQPAMAKWKPVIENAVLRPASVTGAKYDEVSKEFWTAVHETLSGRGTAGENLAALKGRLERLRGAAW